MYVYKYNFIMISIVIKCKYISFFSIKKELIQLDKYLFL